MAEAERCVERKDVLGAAGEHRTQYHHTLPAQWFPRCCSSMPYLQRVVNATQSEGADNAMDLGKQEEIQIASCDQ